MDDKGTRMLEVAASAAATIRMGTGDIAECMASAVLCVAMLMQDLPADQYDTVADRMPALLKQSPARLKSGG